MVSLTKISDWKANAHPVADAATEVSHYLTLEWVKVLRSILGNPDLNVQNYKYIELGGCPGYISDAILWGFEIQERYVVDFVDCRDISSFDPKSRKTFIYADLLNSPHVLDDIDGKKIVSSYGLIEHFTDDDLFGIIRLHKISLNPGDILAIEIPNFSGIKLLWHKLFDRASLKLHNLDLIRNPRSHLSVSTEDYEILFDGWTDPPYVWGNSSVSPVCNRLFIRLLHKVERIINCMLRLTSKGDCVDPRSRVFSAFYLLVLKKR
jgi:hypothetical protein